MSNTSRRFYSSIGLLIVLNAIIKPLWIFGIDRQVQNAVGPHDYGVYFSLFNLSLVLSFLLDWGFTAFFNRQLASQSSGFSARTGSFLYIKLLLVMLYSSVVVLVAWSTGIQRWDIVAGVIGVQALSSLFLFFRAIITAHQWFNTDAWLSVLDKTLMILICGSLLFFPLLAGTMNINKFLLVQCACTALAASTALALLIHKGVRFSVGGSSLLRDRRLFSAVLPYAIIVLLMSVHYRLDGFLLERLHPDGAYEAGIYAAAYRLLDAGNMVGLIVSSFLLPYFARQYSEKASIVPVVLTIRHLLIIFSISIANVAIFLAPWVQQLLYHHTDDHSAQVFRLCLPALIGYSLVNIYGTIMTAAGHIKAFCLITLLAVTLNITINLLLIPSMGAKACAMAALISQLACGITTVLYVKYWLQVKIDSRSSLAYLCIGILVGALLFIGNREIADKWLLLTGAAFLTVLCMLLTKLLRPAGWKFSVNKPHL